MNARNRKGIIHDNDYGHRYRWLDGERVRRTRQFYSILSGDETTRKAKKKQAIAVLEYLDRT
jgi:hypothetical protein